jgi:soluble lytic murein transglycosylase-like protein
MTGAELAAARVGQIQQLIGAVQTRRPLTGGAAAPETSFAATLQNAQAAGVGGTNSATFGGGSPSQFDGLIQQAAQRNGVDPALLKALIRQESNFNPSARSSAGASGLAQLMPGTASALGVTDPTDPAQAVEGGAKYLRQQLDAFGGDPAKALAAYNAGPGAVQRYGGVPPYAETQAYVQRVLGYAREYGSSLGSPAAAPGALSPTLTAPITT